MGLVTWVLPDGKSALGLRLDSAHKKVEMNLLTARDPLLTGETTVGEPITDIGRRGWTYTQDGLLEAREDSTVPTKAVRIKLSRLYPGKQTVYLRYWSKARSTDGQFYWFWGALEEVNPKFQVFNCESDHKRIISGKGGYTDTIYEVCLGTVGGTDKPATEITFKFSRYIWGKTARFAGLRIETEPSADMPLTRDPFLSRQGEVIRQRLLRTGPRSASGDIAYGTAVVPGTVKVRPKSFDSLLGQPLEEEINIHAARGEYENRQVIVFSPDKDLEDVALTVGNLKGPGNATIDSSSILFAPVGFLNASRPYDLGIHGWWPDPILPFLDTFAIRQDDVQALWYRVHVRPETKPGTYLGHATIKPANAPAWKIPVKVTVWDFELPKMSHFRFITMHGPIPDEFMIQYKLNPSHIYDSQYPTDEELKRWADGGVTAFNVRYFYKRDLASETNMPRDGDLEKWCREIGQCLATAEKYGIRDRAYVYLFDEAYKEKWRPAMRLLSETLAGEFPDLLLLTTAHDPSFGEKTGLEKIGAWCPKTYQYSYQDAVEARKKGKQVWWYTCVSPVKPYANLFITEPGSDHRLLMGFMPFAYQSDGFLYYHMYRGWRRPYDGNHITKGPYVDWAMPDDAGDGQICQRGPHGPLPSLRLENMRDGLEDFDYLFIAQRLMKKLSDRNLTTSELEILREKIAPLFEPGNEVVESVRSYTLDTGLLEEKRRLLAQFIQLANDQLQ